MNYKLLVIASKYGLSGGVSVHQTVIGFDAIWEADTAADLIQQSEKQGANVQVIKLYLPMRSGK